MASASFTPDALDHQLFGAFPGYVMRKDLAHEIRGLSKAPSYVIEFMLSKYCANLFDDAEVRAGLRIVQDEIAAYIPRGDETEVIKAAIRERPPRRLIDLTKVELDQSLGKGVYWASLMTANIRNVNIRSEVVERYERLLLAGVWCNLLLQYDDGIRYGRKTYPFVIMRLEPVQIGRVDLEEYRAGREKFTRDQWIDALIRTMGYEPTNQQLTERVKLLYLVRLIPLVENNYHMIELGPRQTGKSFSFTEFSPYGTLLAGGAITVPKLFVSNTQPPRPGLIAQRDVIGFDEIAGSSFNDDDKNLYKN
jgi:ATP-dependent Lon protease